MAPSIASHIDESEKLQTDIEAKKLQLKQYNGQANSGNLLINEPLKTKGLLNDYKSFKTTPVAGTEFPDANLVDWMKAPNSEELLRDLAITSESRTPYPFLCFMIIHHHTHIK